MNACKSCWWQEGGRCYNPSFPNAHPDKGYSDKLATELCDKYWSKRDALGSIIPNEKLIIVSEHTGDE